jgi:hypothetical protein
MDDLQTIVRTLLATRRQEDLAGMVPCSTSTIAMLATGARGKQTSYLIESRLRELARQLRTADTTPAV